MADAKRTVDIVFGAVNNASPEIDKIAGSLDKFDAAVQGAAAPLADLGNKILLVETAVLALAAAFVGSAIDAAGRFGAQVTEIGTLFGGTGEQVGQFEADILKYAQSSTQSIESINGAIYEAISSGVDYSKSLEFLTSAEQLSVAGRADLKEVTDVLTGTLNAYGAATSEASDYTDDLLTAVNLGKTTVPELAQSLSQVTSIAAAAGVPFSDLSAAVAAVTSAGVPTAEAMTKIRAVLETFVSPSQAASKAAEALGLSLDTTTLKSDGLEGALTKIFEATGGTAEGLSKIFTSTEALQGALILGADKSGIFSKALDEMATNTGVTAKAFETMSQNYDVAMQRIVNAADVARIKAGKPLLDEFSDVGNGIADVFKALGTSVDAGAFDPIIQALETFGAEAAETLASIAVNLPDALAGLDFSGLLRALDNLGEEVRGAFEAIFGDIDLETPEGLQIALQKVVDGIAALTNITAGIVDGLTPIFDAFGGLAGAGDDAGEKAQYALGQWLGTAQILVELGAKLGAAVVAISEFGASFQGIFDVIIGGIRLAFNAFEIAIEGIAAFVLTTLQGIFGYLAKLPDSLGGGMWQDAVDSIGSILDGFARSQQNNFGELSDSFDQTAKGLGLIGGAATKTADDAQALAPPLDAAAESGKKFIGIDWSQSATGLDYVGIAAENLGISVNNASAGFDEFGRYIRTAGDESDTARAKTNGYRLEIDELGNRTFIPLIENTKKTTDETEKARKEMEAAAKTAVNYDLELQKIASAERIAYIEAKLKLDEAQLKADTDRLVAAFESVNAAITSTGETLSSLIGSWAQLAGTFEGQKLWDLIMREEARRQQAFEQQKMLLDEQIKYLRARSALLARGDFMLKIDGTGLAPHLDRIFQEILRVCQIRANEQGLELLLGALA